MKGILELRGLISEKLLNSDPRAQGHRIVTQLFPQRRKLEDMFDPVCKIVLLVVDMPLQHLRFQLTDGFAEFIQSMDVSFLLRPLGSIKNKSLMPVISIVRCQISRC